MSTSSRKLLRRLLPAALLTLALLPAAPAQAGRLLVTGHDADFHCSGGPSATDQCHFVEVAVRYVRGGAPDPNKPVLVLDRGNLDFVRALDNAFGAGALPRTVIDPRSPEFATTPINTTTYSAILIASDTTCGGCDLNESGSTPDSDAINARAKDIEAFFNDGGGIFANSGASHGDGDASTGPDNYYSFVPIPVGGVAVSAPFTLTAEGRALGFTDGTGGTKDDINCCATHNSFNLPPAGGALKIAETDSKGLAETLFAEGRISDGTIVERPPGGIPPIFGRGGLVSAPSPRRCVSRRKFRIRIRERGGIKIETAQVFLNRNRIKVVRRRVFARKRHTANINLRGLPKGTFRVRIVVLTTTGDTKRGTRKYRTCTKKRRSRRPPRL
jgi:hypothetical protein